MLTMKQSASLKKIPGRDSCIHFLKWGEIISMSFYFPRNGIKLVRNSVKCDVLNNKKPSASPKEGSGVLQS